MPLTLARVLTGALAVALPAAPCRAQAAPAAPLARVEEVGERLRALADAHPDRARLEQVGRSLSGREIVALRIGPTDGDPPGLLVVAGLDGRRVSDADAALQLAARLLSDAEPDVATRLAQACVTILPLVNPDGAAALLGEDGPVRERAGNGRPDDADRDGRIDEDGPDDLDGDGVIAWMRVPDDKGDWVLDSKDPRALRKARRERGELGAYRLLLEGRDDDVDGEYGEDGTDGCEPDRNFPHGFHADAASGVMPLSEPESRALCDFVLARPRLYAVLVLGGQDTLVDLPRGDAHAPSNWDTPLPALIDDDLASLKEIQRRFRALPGGSDHKVKGAGLTDGSFLAWAYHQAGRLPLALKLWEPPTELPKAKEASPEKDGKPADKDGKEAAAAKDAQDTREPKDGKDAKEGKDGKSAKPAGDDTPGSDASSPVPAAVLAWLDADRGGAGILPWKPFHHPQLGDVELGGLRPGTLFVAPPQVVADKLPLLAGLALAVIDARPRLRFEDLHAERSADGIYALSVALVDDGALPARSALARSAGTTRPVAVHLVLPDDGRRLAGPASARAERLDGGGGRQEFRWVLAARAGEVVRLSADSDALPGADAEVTLP